ncbi:MAG: phosphatase PAP2 family protein [Clostridia bacterium]|nr:phosphatase PAP2 family protein [Clostridia bacterium]
MEFEADIIRFLQTNASAGWINFFQIVTMLGSYLGFIISFIIIFVKNKRLGVVFALTFAVGSVGNYLLKHIIQRDRPFVTYEDIHNYGNEDGYGMPSGHSVCAGLFATFLIYLLFTQTQNKWTRLAGAVCLSLFPFLIAFSRMVLGVHYLSDTIIGIIIGIIVAILGICVYNMCRRKVEKGVIRRQ